MAFFGIAVFATGNTIVFGGFPPANDGNQMIHGELRARKLFFAVVAETFSQNLLPPSALPQFSSFGFFSLLML